MFRSYELKSKVAFANMDGQMPGCNPKYILRHMLKNPTFNNVELVWLLNRTAYREYARSRDNSLPRRVKKVRVDSLRGLYHLSTAKVWIFNTFKTGARIRKRPGQLYVQTGHGSLGIKRVGTDAWGSPRRPARSARAIDVYLSHSVFESRVVGPALGLRDKTVLVGHPRSDLLVNFRAEDRVLSRQSLSIPSEWKAILLAPTFDTQMSRDLPEILIELSQLIASEKTTLLIAKPHPRSRVKLVGGGKIIDASQVPDSTDLLMAADVVISDYSSIMFDAILRATPPHVISFQSENDMFRDSPGLYFDFDVTPIDVVNSVPQLYETIRRGPRPDSEHVRKMLMERQGLLEDGGASIRVARQIAQHLGISPAFRTSRSAFGPPSFEGADGVEGEVLKAGGEFA